MKKKAKREYKKKVAKSLKLPATKNIGNTEKPLSAKMQLFCIEYLKDFNGGEAAKRAGYTKNTSIQMAHKLLKDARIQEYITDKADEIFNKVM